MWNDNGQWHMMGGGAAWEMMLCPPAPRPPDRDRA